MVNGSGSADPTLRTVHLALAAGLLVLAAVAFGLVGPGMAEGLRALRWAWLGLATAALFAAGVVRARLAAPGAPAERVRAAAILVWALGEGQAILGLAVYLVAGDAVPAAVGLLVFLYLWIRYRPSTFSVPS